MYHHLSSVLKLGRKIHTLSFTLMLLHRHTLVIFLGTNIKLEYTKEYYIYFLLCTMNLFTKPMRGKGICTHFCLYNSPAIAWTEWTCDIYHKQHLALILVLFRLTNLPLFHTELSPTFKLAGTLFLLKLTAYINYSSLIKFNWEAKTINIYFLNQHARSTHYLCL